MFFGVDRVPFRFRIGVSPDSCEPLPADKVMTGWEGWGKELFRGSIFNWGLSMELCNRENQITDDRLEL